MDQMTQAVSVLSGYAIVLCLLSFLIVVMLSVFYLGVVERMEKLAKDIRELRRGDSYGQDDWWRGDPADGGDSS